MTRQVNGSSVVPNKLISRFDAPAGSNLAEDTKSVTSLLDRECAHRSDVVLTIHRECRDHHIPQKVMAAWMCCMKCSLVWSVLER